MPMLSVAIWPSHYAWNFYCAQPPLELLCIPNGKLSKAELQINMSSNNLHNNIMKGTIGICLLIVKPHVPVR